MKIYKFINSNICTMIILFAFYSFLGWTCEVLYAYSLHHHFVNRGFFTGPFCTIYGFGFLMIYLFLNKFKNKICSLFIFSILFTSYRLGSGYSFPYTVLGLYFLSFKYKRIYMFLLFSNLGYWFHYSY